MNTFNLELLRRSHCDHKNKGNANHKCRGRLTIMPGMCMLDCSLCGTATNNTGDLLDLTNEELKAESDVFDFIHKEINQS